MAFINNAAAQFDSVCSLLFSLSPSHSDNWSCTRAHETTSRTTLGNSLCVRRAQLIFLCHHPLNSILPANERRNFIQRFSVIISNVILCAASHNNSRLANFVFASIFAQMYRTNEYIMPAPARRNRKEATEKRKQNAWRVHIIQISCRPQICIVIIEFFGRRKRNEPPMICSQL